MAEAIGAELGKDWEEFGMTTPRTWPNNAGEARDQSAEYAQDGLRELSPILHGTRITEADQMRRVGSAAHCLEEILRRMEAVGAKTNPLDDYWLGRRNEG